MAACWLHSPTEQQDSLELAVWHPTLDCPLEWIGDGKHDRQHQSFEYDSPKPAIHIFPFQPLRGLCFTTQENQPNDILNVIPVEHKIQGEAVPSYDDLHSIANEASGVVVIERLTHHIQRIRETQDRMEKSVSQIADALTRLALVEERQASTSTSIDRLAASVEKLDERLKALEVMSPNNSRIASMVDKALWGVAGGALIFLVQKVMAG